MFESLLEFDTHLFRLINSGMSGDLLNVVVPWLREPLVWVPLYMFFVALLVINFKGKALWCILAFGMTVAVADLSSSRLIKKLVKRERPCNTPELHKDIKVLVHCGSGYSYTSSHATNHMAVAIFFFLTLGAFMPLFKWLLVAWAVSVGFAQVYVGVHYPLDVISGFILGFLIGNLGARIYLHVFKSNILKGYGVA